MSFQELSSDLQQARMHVWEAESYNSALPNYRNQSVLVPPELKYMQSALALCRLVTKVFEERLDVKDVFCPGNDALTTEMRTWWARNNLPELGSMVHSEALITGRGYMTISSDPREPDKPIFAVESPHAMVHAIDKRTGETTEALRLYDQDRRAVYYDQEHAEYLRQAENGWGPDPDVPEQVVRYDFGGLLPVVPFLNRGRVFERWGRPESLDIRPLQDAVAQAFTDLRVATALMPTPQRAIFGVDDEDVTDEEGNSVPGQELYMARLLTFAEAQGKISEFQAAQLSNFTQTLMYHTRLASALSGIPTTYFAIASEANPASGDAIVADESRLVKRSERLTRGFSRPWKDVHTVGAMIAGYSKEEAESIHVEWQSPGTHTQSAQADWAVKIASIQRPDGTPLVSDKWLLSKLGLTPDEIEQMDDERDTTALRQLMTAPRPESGQADGDN